MLQMRSDQRYGRSVQSSVRSPVQSMVVLLLVAMSLFVPAVAQAAQTSVASYQYGYDWADEADECMARYYVHRGDTLSRIAARYGVSVYAIARINGIQNINRIYPGQYLCIPAHDEYHDGYHDWYDDEYRHQHDDDEGYHKKGDDGDYGHKRHDDDGYGPVEEEYPDPGYYQTSGGHTGVCYYPDPRYNSEEAEFYEDDERPDCS